MAAKRKPREVTDKDLERGMAELERREEALSHAARWPEGRTIWDRLTEEDEIQDDDVKP